jgi:mono/diheme cytochrome c family protein
VPVLRTERALATLFGFRRPTPLALRAREISKDRDGAHEHVDASMMSYRSSLCAVACAATLAAHARAQNAGASTGTAATDARALFLANCAMCHGETGDGKGVTQLEKPARSFKDGGFSYGNTPEAVLRTITNGIPGTPMPSFASALKEPDRKALAEYVISLGPPQTKASEAETILTVPSDRALFVRGKLPPIVDGASVRPRGLLVGTPDGFTFEYRVDDVRLLGVRQGAFVERMDWNERGGVPLKPLGKLVYTFGDGNPGPMLTLVGTGDRGTTPLTARLAATVTHDGRPSIAYILYSDSQPLRTREAWVEESPHASTSAIGSGFARSFAIEELGNGGRYALLVSSTKGAKTVAAADASEHSKHDWLARPRPDGAFEIELVRGLTQGEAFTVSGDDVRVEISLEPGAKRAIELVTLLAPAWNADVMAKWTKELQ